MKPVATMGDNCLDHYLPPLDREFVGGNALNVAVGLRDLGHDVAYAGAIGTDDAGRVVLAAAQARGIDTTHVQTCDGATGVTTIRLTDDGDRIFESEVLGTSAGFRATPAALSDLGRRAWIHGAGLWGGVDGFTSLRRAGTRLSYDFSHVSSPERIAELAPHLDVAFLSAPGADDDEAAALGRRAVADGAATAVVTRGRHGSLAVSGEIHHQPPVPVTVVDTLGAGDAYIAACISALVEGAPLRVALEHGAEAAARTCTHYGAWQEPEALEASA
ncbi:MAG TPA: PfkB family carbohydrate kinase [Gaiellales bacterium]